MKLVTWNVNGIRSVGRKNFFEWFKEQEADLVCVQEIKARPDQLEENLLHPGNYHSYWHPADKPGYSGVAIYAKKEPLRVINGIGCPTIDAEGRVIIAEYKSFVLINAYFPNSQREHTRLGYKLAFCEKMFNFCEKFRNEGKQVVLCGDFNIAHHSIDLKNPKTNLKSAGFLPEERAWMDHLIHKEGYLDTFRHFVKEPGHYTWWSHRPGVRDKNIGWRLDYFVVNPEFKNYLKSVRHEPETKGSDHCPVVLELDC
jgi:exodeoxyribonuclease-3